MPKPTLRCVHVFFFFLFTSTHQNFLCHHLCNYQNDGYFINIILITPICNVIINIDKITGEKVRNLANKKKKTQLGFASDMLGIYENIAAVDF